MGGSATGRVAKAAILDKPHATFTNQEKDETIASRGTDVVIEAAGFPSAIPEGLQMVRASGDYIE